ncbi:hypothetical protein RWE15_09730 [Virgibacillus halophilus]|uniref:Uncharacterized protein n=1 Tax=Tigheibacillus halophilus TaxID=361280 RepID=A0ABU5C5S5_9BACI|nr:hypothetical protein [Virgibacillus halophilus]
MRIKRNMTKLTTVILFVLFCITLAACSSDEGNQDKGKSAKNSDMSNTLVYAGESEDTINPILNSHDELPDIIFSGLMKYDAKGKPIVDLAESYQFDKGTNTYTFKLKKRREMA